MKILSRRCIMKRDHRLRIFDAQTVSFALKTPWSDGTIHVLLSPEELIEKVGDAGAAATMPARPGAGRLRNRTWPPLGRLCSLFRRTVAGRTACSALWRKRLSVRSRRHLNAQPRTCRPGPPGMDLAISGSRRVRRGYRPPVRFGRGANWSKRGCELESDTHRGAE